LVFTIEIVEPLAKQSEERLTRLGYENIEVRLGDGFQGWPEKAPFDAIIVTCAPEEIPEALIEQLKEGGRMIIPVGPDGGLQKLIRVAKVDGEIRTTGILDVRFVPMTGGE
ncbi:MAG: protein-L-isoaspartate(D-aspartate) O-methyltransferase, partial [Verrucomicrobiota bacterium]